MKVITTSEKQTFNLGKKIAKSLTGGEVLALSGDLGAGKTILTKGIAEGLGIKKIVNSPTFILMNIYEIKVKGQKSKVKNLVHIDCYRIKSADEIKDIGASEYFADEDSVVIVEWAEKIKKLLPKKVVKIDIKIKEGNKREIKWTKN